MTAALYRKGNTHIDQGIECEIVRVPNKFVEDYLNDGYVKTPQELLEPKEEIKVIPTKEEADTNGTGKLSSEEVRAAAEKAGIKDYGTKRIATLKKELGYDD